MMDKNRIKELKNMQEVRTYDIKVRGELEENTFNATSPLGVTVVKVDRNATFITVCADQSGLIGLIRHLHNQGFVFLSVFTEGRTGR
jgi:hypothetical protein